jgi:hypothetical protein
MRLLSLAAGAFLGMLVCYEVGAFVMCDFVWPNSNLCGLPSVFVAAPIGLVLGAILGWRFTRPAAESSGIK